MAKFARPNGAIADYNEIKAGDELYHVYGIRVPFCSGPSKVVAAPMRFADHKDWSDAQAGSEDKIVFDVVVVAGRENYVDMCFASDGNLIPGYSHNDNYWFSNEQSARAAVEYLRKQHAADQEPSPVEYDDFESWTDDDRYFA